MIRFFAVKLANPRRLRPRGQWRLVLIGPDCAKIDRLPRDDLPIRRAPELRLHAATPAWQAALERFAPNHALETLVRRRRALKSSDHSARSACSFFFPCCLRR